MSKNQAPQIPQYEKKERIPAWLYPSTLEVIDGAMQTANCKSRSEFLANAAKFYAGYISAEDAVSFLPAVGGYTLSYHPKQREPHCPFAVQAGGRDRHDDECAGGGHGGAAR